MGDLKPLGSEKLNGDDKLKRILELAYYKQGNKNTTQKAELVKESTKGTVYGIVKEKDGYYVKKGLNEQSLDYIGGMFMKNKNRFSSYAEALKRLELLRGQENLTEATKYVLKQNKPATDLPAATEAPAPEPALPGPESMSPPADLPPSPEMGAEPSSDLPLPGGEGGEMPPSETGDELPIPGEEPGVEGGESKRSDYMAEVQKFAGKLGQELRDQKEKMESDDIKYVLNMVISAVDLDKLEFEDLEEIGKKFDREEEESPETEEVPSEEPSGEEIPSGEEVPSEEPVTPEGELEEVNFSNPMDQLEKFVKTPIAKKEIDLSKYAMKEDELYEEDVVELDLDEIKNQINQSVNQILGKHFK